MGLMLLFTVLWAWHIHKRFNPQSRYINLDSIYEVQRGETSEMSLGDADVVNSSHT